MYQCQYPKIAQVEYKDAKMNTNLYLYDKKTFACDTQSYLDQYSSSCYVATPRQEVDLIYFEFNTFRKYSVFEILSRRQNILNLHLLWPILHSTISQGATDTINAQIGTKSFQRDHSLHC